MTRNRGVQRDFFMPLRKQRWAAPLDAAQSRCPRRRVCGVVSLTYSHSSLPVAVAQQCFPLLIK